MPMLLLSPVAGVEAGDADATTVDFSVEPVLVPLLPPPLYPLGTEVGSGVGD